VSKKQKCILESIDHNKKIQLTVGSAVRFQRSFFYQKFSALLGFIEHLPTASDFGVTILNTDKSLLIQMLSNSIE